MLFPAAWQGAGPVPLYLPLCRSISHHAGQHRASPVAAASPIVQLGSGCPGPPHLLPPVPQPARGCQRCSERSWQRCSPKLCILILRASRSALRAGPVLAGCVQRCRAGRLGAGTASPCRLRLSGPGGAGGMSCPGVVPGIPSVLGAGCGPAAENLQGACSQLRGGMLL